MKRRVVYGPVPSRRFGLSLGVDLVPYKTCCYDCVYCQLGRTPEPTCRRQEFVAPREVIAEVESALGSGPRPEVITLAGSGEPTLHGSLGAVIQGLRRRFHIPVVLLTNGGLLFDQDVAADARLADILAPSLDAGDQETFSRINRPHPAIGFERMLQGLCAAARGHPGRVKIEVMLTAGLNDSAESIARLAECLGSIPAHSVDINTPVRPAGDRNGRPCPPDTLQAARQAFGPRARVVAGFAGRRAAEGREEDAEQAMLALLSRRPCTLEDVVAALGIPADRALELLEGAVSTGRARRRASLDKTFYLAMPG